MATRIVQVAVTSGRSGTEQVLLDLTQRLVADGAAVTVVIPTGAASLDGMHDEALQRGADVERVAPLYPGDRDHVGNLKEMYWLLRRLRPALVHYHIPRVYSGSETILAGFMARVPRRVRTDQNPIADAPTRLQLARLRATDLLVHRIALVSRDNLHSHLAVGARPPGKCVVVPNGIDMRDIPLEHSASERTDLRRELGLPTEAPMTVMVAALEPRKGAFDYVDAAEVASRAMPTLHHAVIGDGEILPALKARAASLGVADRVHFLGRRRDVRRILHAFDVFVLPSHFEGLALTMLEALASGLPMVATRVDGVSDVLPDGRGCLLVDRHDPEALGREMTRLAGNPSLRHELVAIACPRVRGEFTADAAYRRYRALYAETGLFDAQRCG